MKAADFMNKIYKVKFNLSLAALVDIYRAFRELFDILQIVNILPHEKFDSFNNSSQKLLEMPESVSLGDCLYMNLSQSRDENSTSDVTDIDLEAELPFHGFWQEDVSDF